MGKQARLKALRRRLLGQVKRGGPPELAAEAYFAAKGRPSEHYLAARAAVGLVRSLGRWLS